MKVRYDIRKNAYGNAAAYFEQAKKLKGKAEGMKKAIVKTHEEIEEESHRGGKEKEKRQPRIKREKKAHEKFRHFFTSSGLLAIGGRDAKQNDALVARHMEEGDLFFHADIQGGSVVILKRGGMGGTEDAAEAAQFAACYSNAWKSAAAVDAYCVKPLQVSKHSSGGYVGQGGYVIEGERVWFRGTRLELVIGSDGGGIACVQPAMCKRKLQSALALAPGEIEKGKAAAQIATELGVHVDEVLQILPAGNFQIKRLQ